MTSYIRLIGNDPVELVRNSIKAIKANRNKNKSIETSEIVNDDLRAEIETIFGISIPCSVERFKFICDPAQYTSPLMNSSHSSTMTIYVGPEEEIDRIIDEIDQFWIRSTGRYRADILCGFVSDEALETTYSEELFAFIQDYVKVIICEKQLKKTPWELYNMICPFLSCIPHSHIDECLELYSHMVFNKFHEFSYTDVSGASFSTAEIGRASCRERV